MKKFIKKGRKAFTLVELLVVIAIIAILATVSTVGYLGFTNEAKKSNDFTELTQYKTIIEGKLLDGEEEVKVDETTYLFTYTDGKLECTVNNVKVTESNLKDAIEALVGADAIEDATISGTVNEGVIKTVTYSHHYKTNSTTWTVGSSVTKAQ